MLEDLVRRIKYTILIAKDAWLAAANGNGVHWHIVGSNNQKMLNISAEEMRKAQWIYEQRVRSIKGGVKRARTAKRIKGRFAKNAE